MQPKRRSTLSHHSFINILFLIFVHRDHVPFRNSKLTRMLQPSLSGNARISVICTINPDPSAVTESTSTLLFAQRVKRVQVTLQLFSMTSQA